jgi:integrase
MGSICWSARTVSGLLFVRPGELRLARWKDIDFEKSTQSGLRRNRACCMRQSVAVALTDGKAGTVENVWLVHSALAARCPERAPFR